MRGFRFVLTILMVLLVSIMVVTVGAACTTEGIELAEMRKYDAKARAEAAPIAAQAVVIEAGTNATLEKLRLLTDIDKEIRSFDAQIARQEFATTVLEMQALNLAIRGEVEAAKNVTEELERTSEGLDGVVHDSRAAAGNSWLTLLLIPISNVVMLSVMIGLGAAVTRDLYKRLDGLGGASD